MDTIPFINSTEIVIEVTNVLLRRFEWLYGVMKGVGVLLILYLIYLLFNVYTNRKMKKRIKNIVDKVEKIDTKLDVLISEFANNFSKRKKSRFKKIKENKKSSKQKEQ